MGKISNAAKAVVEQNKLQSDKVVTNFMGGDSYTINPLDTLKMISASSIFGEPSYYRGSKLSKKSHGHLYRTVFSDSLFMEYSILPMEMYNEKTEDLMIKAIDNALDYDFEGTIKWAQELRTDYFMRLNPQVIMVRAAMHPKRKEFTSTHPDGAFRDAMKACMTRADDPINGMSYFIYANGGKTKMPSIMKRAYADKISSLSSYELHKYQNAGIGMINAVRICHANSSVINELMTNGKLEVTEDELTWENLRSAGKSWIEIFHSTNMGHMALLRNLRGFCSEVEDVSSINEYLNKLRAGVKKGKQFPFRYYSAYKAVQSDDNVHCKGVILDALEDCLDISCENLPKLHGRTMVLSDNSGSAWGAFQSEYGSVTVAEIDNLSAVITASRSDEGYVGVFGDRLLVCPISKHNGILKQAMEISSTHGNHVGGSTEGGIWKFFRDAMKAKEHWDNIFIYSDQQAGHGGLYGTDADKREYKNYLIGSRSIGYINVFKLILDYRKTVYKDVNVFSIQTAGYDNSIIPEYAYRTNIMYGWTGKEIQFADAMIKQWNVIQSRNIHN